MAQPFVEERLPEEVERGAVGGPMFKTIITPLASGHEQRNISWSQSRAEWDIGYGLSHLKPGKSQSYLNQVIAFFYARRGRAVGFRFKDWTDYEVEDVTIGVGDTSTVDFQAVKIYNEGGLATYTRILSKLVTGTVVVKIDGTPTVAFTVDVDTGIITMDTAPAGGEVISLTCEFDVPVRFDVDKLDVTAITQSAGSIGSIPIVEVRQD